MATKPTGHQKCEGKNDEGLDLKYGLLDLSLNLSDKVASCRLRMPLQLPRGFTEQVDDPVMYLELLPSGEDLTYCLKLMTEVMHPNILHCRLLHKNEVQTKKNSETTVTDYWALVEPYTGIVFDYLEKNLGSSYYDKSGMIVLPTYGLRTVVRHAVDGLEHLMLQGYYHGGFSLKCTYYRREDNGSLCVKLAGFKKRSEKKTMCQKGDLLSLADELEQLSSIARELNITAAAKKNGPCFDTYQMDDLAKKLKQVTEANLHQIYPEIKRHPFFWVGDHRKYFFVYEVAVAMKEEERFRRRIEGNEDICPLPWDLDDYDGFLEEMNKYRKKLKKKLYDGFSRCSFIKLVIGLYSHEHLLMNEPHRVDKTIQGRHPRLCVLLRNLLGSQNADWM